MKQAWCLAASSTSATSRALMRLYGKRWGIVRQLHRIIFFFPCSSWPDIRRGAAFSHNLSACRRASTMEVELERMEGQLSLGEEVDLEAYSRIAQRLHAILGGLGLKRVPRVVNDGSEELINYHTRRKPA